MGEVTQASALGQVRALAASLVLYPGRDLSGAVALAEDLVAAGLASPATVAVASLSRGVTRRDGLDPVREMLMEFDITMPDPVTEHARYAAALDAFAHMDLPMTEFEGHFYGRLPAVQDQDALDQTIVQLLDERDHQTTPAARDAVEHQIRDAIRANSSGPNY